MSDKAGLARALELVGARDIAHVEGMLASGQPFWLDIDSADPRQHALLKDVFDFHPLAVEDTLNPHTRVKIEEYDGYFFIVLRAMRFDPERPLDSRELRVKKLCLFLGASYVVSVHSGPSSSVERARALIRDDAALRGGEDPAFIAHAITDAVIDAYFPILDRVDAFVDRLETSGLRDLERADFDEILRFRRLAFAASRSLAPQQEILDVLAHRTHRLIPSNARLYFRDVFDHAQRIMDSLDAYRELIADTTDSYLARLSMRLNYATTMFSAIATIAIPFLIVSGLYGMNFTSIPLSANPHGFWIAVGLQAAISGGLLAILRWRHLL